MAFVMCINLTDILSPYIILTVHIGCTNVVKWLEPWSTIRDSLVEISQSQKAHLLFLSILIQIFSSENPFFLPVTPDKA